MRQPREDVLHSHPHSANGVVGLLLGFAQRLAARGFAHEELLGVEFDEMRFVLGAVIGAIGQHGLVFVIKQLLEHLAVMHAGGCGAGFEDELGLQVGFDVVLPAEVRFVVLLAPACFAVFLAAYGGVLVELCGALALLDALVLLAVVALARGFDEAGVDDAAFAGDEAFAFEDLVKGFEELTAAFAPVVFDALLEVPDRFGVGNVVADAQAEEGFKARAVEDLLLRGVVAQAVELLQHEDFEHEHGVEGGLAALLPIARGVAGEVFEQRAEALPGDEVAQLEDAAGLGGDGLFVLNGAEESSSSFGLAVAFHGSLHRSSLRLMKAGPRENGFQRCP